MAKRFYCILRDEREIRHDIEIWDSSFSGTALEFKAGPEGFDLRYSQNSERTAVFMATECTINMQMQSDDHFALVTDLQGAAEGRFTVKITKGDTPVLYWVGMVLPDIGRYNEEYYPTLFEIRATDGLGLLKDVEFKDTGGAYTGKARIINHITLCLNKLPYVATHFGGSDFFVKSHVDWWEETMADTASDPDALYQSYIDHATWWKYDKGEQKFLSCYEVLKNILTVFGCRITQAEGAFWIEQLTYRAAATIVTRRYSKTGTLLSTANYAGYNDIAQTQDGALLAVGTYEFFPALSKATHVFKAVERRNFLSGANINQTTPTQTMYFPLQSNSGNTVLRMTGNLTGQVQNLTATTYPQPIAAIFKIRLLLDTVALKRAYYLKPTYQIDYSAMEWAAGAHSCYFVVSLPSGIPPNSAAYIPTFTQKIDLELPQVPEDVTQFIFAVEFDSLRKFDGTLLSAANFEVSWQAENPWIEVYSNGNPVLTADETLYETYNTIQTTNTVAHETESLIGTSTDPNTIGAIWVKPSSAYVLADDWGEGTDTPDRELEKLLTEFVLSGQHAPLRRLQGTLFGDITAMRRVLWDGVYWMLLGGTYSAGKNEFSGEWVQIDYAPGLSASPPKRRKLTKIDPPVPPAPTTGLNGAGSIYEIQSKPPGTLLYPVAQTTTSSEIAAGVVASIPVTTTLAAGDFYAGDTISIVNPITGNFESLTVTATSLAGDTAIAVSGTLLHDYITNAPLIKKPLIGTFSLPAGATGQVLRHDGTKWVPYGTAAGMAEGTVLTWNDATGWTAQATGTVTGSGTAGQVAFWSAGSAISGENNLWWDATNDRLGIGLNNPLAPLVIAKSTGDHILLGESEIKMLGQGIANHSIICNAGAVKGLFIGTTDSTGTLGAPFTPYLKVGGTTESEFFQLLKLTALKISTGAAAGRVLQSDAAGLAAWVDQWTKDGAVAGLWTDVTRVTVGGTAGSQMVLRNADSGTGTASNDNYNVLILRPHVATDNNWAAIAGYSQNGGIAGDIAFRIVDHVSQYADIVFHTRAASGYTHRMWIKSDGKVGIGTDSPAQVFHVAGAARITGSSGTATTFLGRNASGDLSEYTMATASFLGRNTAGTGSVEVLSTATVRTMLGYLLGTLTATRIPFSIGGNDLGDDALLTWNNTTKRLSVGNTGGSPAASVHIAEGSVASWEPLRAVGTVSGNMIVTLWNAQNSGGASHFIMDLIVGGASAGDSMLRWLVNGAQTWCAGIDNDDGDKWKLKPQTTPSTGSNQGITITTANPSNVGINNDSPAHPLDVTGRARADVMVARNGTFGTTFGTGAGTSPSLTTLQGSSNGFVFAFSTGTSPTANGNIITFTLPTGFPSAMYPTFSAGNAQTATDIAKFYIDSAGTSVLVLRANGTLSASTAYKLYFNISGI